MVLTKFLFNVGSPQPWWSYGFYTYKDILD